MELAGLLSKHNLICNEFLCVFKGARSAPRAQRRVTAHAVTAEELTHTASAGATPAGTPPHHTAAARLTAKRTAAAARHGPRTARRTS
jgi:hypothetical protein